MILEETLIATGTTTAEVSYDKQLYNTAIERTIKKVDIELNKCAKYGELKYVSENRYAEEVLDHFRKLNINIRIVKKYEFCVGYKYFTIFRWGKIK